MEGGEWVGDVKLLSGGMEKRRQKEFIKKRGKGGGNVKIVIKFKLIIFALKLISKIDNHLILSASVSKLHNYITRDNVLSSTLL